jgi:RNA repair, ligase-Pnkp-associating, region of Hen1
VIGGSPVGEVAADAEMACKAEAAAYSTRTTALKLIVYVGSVSGLGHQDHQGVRCDAHFPLSGSRALTTAETLVRAVVSLTCGLRPGGGEPVPSDAEHYWVSPDEVDKLIRAAGAGWLAVHPDRELIAHRHLAHQRHLSVPALERLAASDDLVVSDTLTWVERNFGYAVARAYAGHSDSGSDAGTTTTYVRQSGSGPLSVSLTRPDPSGSTGPTRLRRGCSHPQPASRGRGCRQLHPAATTAKAMKVSHLHPNKKRLVAHHRPSDAPATRAARIGQRAVRRRGEAPAGPCAADQD